MIFPFMINNTTAIVQNLPIMSLSPKKFVVVLYIIIKFLRRFIIVAVISVIAISTFGLLEYVI